MDFSLTSFLLQDVLSVAFSADNRQIVSGSRDKTIKLWNTLAQCKYTIQEEGHTDWVSCVRFSPNNNNPVIVSCGWDRMVKVCFRPTIFFSNVDDNVLCEWIAFKIFKAVVLWRDFL